MPPADPPLVPGFGRFVRFLVVVAAGAAIAETLHLHRIDSSSGYLLGATTLLAVGLFASTSGIPLAEFKADIGIVVAAVTVGVLAKTALIAAVMFALFRKPEYVVLSVAVAQVDPLSVAAIRGRAGMSRRAAAILSAWSSFDDPVTALITVYLLGLLFPAAAIGDGGSIVTQLAFNAVLAGGAYLGWRLASQAWSSRYRPLPAQLAVLAVVMTLAVWQFLMIGLAVAGLFLRPRAGRLVERSTQVAFWVATFALGLVLVDGVVLGPAAVLGLAAFGSHVVVGWLLTYRLPRHDRIDLTLAHQNGITAIILALLLEPRLPGAVAVVAPAIVVVNLVHSLANGAWNARRRRARRVSVRSRQREHDLPLNPLA